MTNELELRDYIRIIRKRLWLTGALIIIMCGLTAYYNLYVKEKVYVASTKIIVTQPASQAINPLDLNQINSNIQLINTYKEVIKTLAILDQVVLQHPEFGLTSEQLMGKINVSSVNNTQVMTLVVRDTSYKKAAQIVNAVSQVFKQTIPTIFNIENVVILNEAKLELTTPPVPVEPNVSLNIMISFVFALMIGVGLSFLLEYMDDTIKSESEVEQLLQLPVLAVLAKESPSKRKGKSTKHQITIGR